jgi:hypothetical protein
MFPINLRRHVLVAAMGKIPRRIVPRLISRSELFNFAVMCWSSEALVWAVVPVSPISQSVRMTYSCSKSPASQATL